MRATIHRVVRLTLMLTIMSGMAVAADAAKTADRSRAVRLQVVVSQEREDKRPVEPPRTYRLVVLDNGEMARLISGWRIPIPVTAAAAQQDSAALTAYTYQNVGTIIGCRVQRAGADAFELTFNLDDSPFPSTGPGREQPTIENMNLELTTIVIAGKPQVVGRLARPDGTARLVEVLIEPL